MLKSGLLKLPSTLATDAELETTRSNLAQNDQVAPLPSLGLNDVPSGVTITATSEYPGYSAQNVYRQLNGTELWYTLAAPTPQAKQILTIEFSQSYVMDGYRFIRVNQENSTPFGWEVETREGGIWKLRDKRENTPWSTQDDYIWGRLADKQDGIRLTLIDMGATPNIAGVWRFYPLQAVNANIQDPRNDIFTQASHGFIKGDVILPTPTGWVKSQRNVPGGWGRQMVAQVLSVDMFRIAKEGTIFSGIPIINPVVGSRVYQGSAAGTLTCDTPVIAQGQSIIIMGDLLPGNLFLYSPESRRESP